MFINLKKIRSLV